MRRPGGRRGSAGALPGIGATTAAFVCYGEAWRSAKKDARFGDGDPRGIAAPEAGNNAVAASSLIPPWLPWAYRAAWPLR